MCQCNLPECECSVPVPTVAEYEIMDRIRFPFMFEKKITNIQDLTQRVVENKATKLKLVRPRRKGRGKLSNLERRILKNMLIQEAFFDPRMNKEFSPKESVWK